MLTGPSSRSMGHVWEILACMGWTLDMVAAARTEKTHLHELLLPTLLCCQRKWMSKTHRPVLLHTRSGSSFVFFVRN